MHNIQALWENARSKSSFRDKECRLIFLHARFLLRHAWRRVVQAACMHHRMHALMRRLVLILNGSPSVLLHRVFHALYARMVQPLVSLCLFVRRSATVCVYVRVRVCVCAHMCASEREFMCVLCTQT